MLRIASGFTEKPKNFGLHRFLPVYIKKCIKYEIHKISLYFIRVLFIRIIQHKTENYK